MKTEHDLRIAITQSLDVLSSMREWVTHQADQLATEFWEARKAVQTDAMAQRPRQHGLERRLADSYAPLALAFRDRSGTAEIFWMLTHHGRYHTAQTRLRPIHRYLARGARKDLTYSTRTLRKHTRKWEVDLVLAFEARAACLRRLFATIAAAVRALKAILQVLTPTLPPPGAPVAQAAAPNPDGSCGHAAPTNVLNTEDWREYKRAIGNTQSDAEYLRDMADPSVAPPPRRRAT